MNKFSHEIFMISLMIMALLMALILAIDVLHSKTSPVATSPTTACPVRIELVHIR